MLLSTFLTDSVEQLADPRDLQLDPGCHPGPAVEPDLEGAGRGVCIQQISRDSQGHRLTDVGSSSQGACQDFVQTIASFREGDFLDVIHECKLWSDRAVTQHRRQGPNVRNECLRGKSQVSAQGSGRFQLGRALTFRLYVKGRSNVLPFSLRTISLTVSIPNPHRGEPPGIWVASIRPRRPGERRTMSDTSAGFMHRMARERPNVWSFTASSSQSQPLPRVRRTRGRQLRRTAGCRVVIR